MYLNDANFMVLFYKESPSEIYFWSFLCQHHNCIKSNKVHTLRSLPKKQKKKHRQLLWLTKNIKVLKDKQYYGQYNGFQIK
jgi:F420-0:gamma-glutamyl ligase-like protein